MFTVTNGSVYLCKVFTWSDCLVSSEQLGIELRANKVVQRIRPALLDPVFHIAVPILIICFSN